MALNVIDNPPPGEPFDSKICEIIHDQLEDDIKEIKSEVEKLKPQTWPMYAKIMAGLGILGFLGSLLMFGINMGKTVSKNEFDPVATDVAVSKTKISNIETKLQESAVDRKEMNSKLDMILQRLIK